MRKRLKTENMVMGITRSTSFSQFDKCFPTANIPKLTPKNGLQALDENLKKEDEARQTLYIVSRFLRFCRVSSEEDSYNRRLLAFFREKN
ncbi:hypothetical protein RRG08_007774 [Elysia crispata]|uniref:Uncharacterized protein n=1 Tax=Elysia crispata TaxID=231223 RepID=A0AAE1B258_9GAST|nr:hypothetical protein RRG08_007774 [Elysia crispata]